VLTLNSARRLDEVLSSARRVADELLVIDSGSTDATCAIAERHAARVVTRPFDNFRDQRVFAEDQCRHSWILELDSDEVVSEPLVERILALKSSSFDSGSGHSPDAFAIRRDWFFLGRPVRVFYPVTTPEYVIRLFRKDRMSHRGSRGIHESLQFEHGDIARLEEALLHYSVDSIEDLYGKIGLYTKLCAVDMAERGVKANWAKVHMYPWLVWFKWYLLLGGWRDGEAGRVLARFARDTVYLKYLKLKHDNFASESPSAESGGRNRERPRTPIERSQKAKVARG
jgi:glycosyltransferase involved in cell wall biosynthesis